MWIVAKRFALCAAGLVLVEAAAHAQLQMAPNMNQNPYNAGASGASTNNRFFNQGGQGGGGGAGGYNQFNLGPYASMSSNPNNNNNQGFGGGYGGFGGIAPWYNPWNPGLYNMQSGNLYGAAAVIDAQNQRLTSVQQAYLMREQVRREKLENRRRIFEEWLYERNNTPTAQDEFERIQRIELRRAQNDPPITEIFSGKALNDLLKDAQRLHGKGGKGPSIAFDPAMLKNINFTPDGKGNASAGLLKNFSGQLSWPVTLKAPEFDKERQLVDRLTKDAIAQANSAGAVDFGTLKELGSAAERLEQGLKAALREGLPSTQYVPAKNFLSNLENSVKALGDTDAAKFVGNKFAPSGRSMEELIKDMTSKGLIFAAYVPGEEAAYLAMHRMLAAYDVTMNSLHAQQ